MMQKERLEIMKYCKKLIECRLTRGTGGNISIFDPKEKLFAISPSGIDYFEMEPEDIVVMNLEGEIVEGKRIPSTEHELHRIFYVKRNDIHAVIHTHATYSKVLATLREPLPASSYMVAYAGYDVRCAEYATFGTRELAHNVFEAMKERNAALMANHGLIAGGSDINSTFNIAEEIEFCAEVYVKARMIGEPVLLDKNEMSLMLQKFKKGYGQNR